jgi:hypothetical protein
MNIRKIIKEEIEGVFNDIYGKKYSKVEYTGVVIEGESVDFFENELSKRLIEIGLKIPKDWQRPDNYHMTITLGELGLGIKLSGIIGAEVTLQVNSIGISDNAIAVGVSGVFSRNKFQHITLAFKNRAADSNEIVNWVDISPFKIKGYIREVDRVGGWGKLR